MANMKLIEAKTVGAGGIASIEFTTIPQTYTDLIIMASGRSDSSTDISIKFNNDSGANYPWQRLLGTGSSIIVGNNTANNLFNNMLAASPAYTANIFGNGRIYITNYTSATGKSVSIDGVTENNSSGSFVALTAGSWTGTAAITSIQIGVDGGGTLLEHSTFYLYGVSNTIVSGAKAYGGYVTEDSNYWYHTFLSTGVFTPTQSLTADIMCIAGGGAGGMGLGGGGGAGGFRVLTSQSLTTTAYTCTIGGGGAGATSGGLKGISGTNSSFAGSGFSTITSTGGGGGAGATSGQTPSTGGSGGGGSYSNNAGASGNAGGYSPVEGYGGGTGFATNPNFGCGGGGGAGGAGGNAVAGTSNGVGGVGSNAYASWATATLTGVDNGYYAGGGGGSYQQGTGFGGVGGLGGGGNASTGNPAGSDISPATSGIANTGGGGGGAEGTNLVGAGSGGSGLVIVRYAK